MPLRQVVRGVAGRVRRQTECETSWRCRRERIRQSRKAPGHRLGEPILVDAGACSRSPRRRIDHRPVMTLDVAAKISRRSVRDAPWTDQRKRDHGAQSAGERRLRVAQYGRDRVGRSAERGALVWRSGEDVLGEDERLSMNEQHERVGADVARGEALEQRSVARGAHEAQRRERLGRGRAALASEDVDVDVRHRGGISEDEKLGAGERLGTSDLRCGDDAVGIGGQRHVTARRGEHGDRDEDGDDDRGPPGSAHDETHGVAQRRRGSRALRTGSR